MPNSGGTMFQRRTTCLKSGNSRGFTLVELMITLAVIGAVFAHDEPRDVAAASRRIAAAFAARDAASAAAPERSP